MSPRTWPSPHSPGYLATKAMEPVSIRLYELESEKDRQREDAVRPGPPYEIAAKKIGTHLRGFLSHLVFGLAVAATTETAWALRGRRA